MIYDLRLIKTFKKEKIEIFLKNHWGGKEGGGGCPGEGEGWGEGACRVDMIDFDSLAQFWSHKIA